MFPSPILSPIRTGGTKRCATCQPVTLLSLVAALALDHLFVYYEEILSPTPQEHLHGCTPQTHHP